jgi:Domain of unknown function (DUF4288)
MSSDSWYGVKCLYRHTAFKNPVYEERVILVRASDQDAALERAEELSQEYEDEACTYIGYALGFEMFDTVLEEGTEVFSLMRTSELSPKEYLDRFYDTGAEHTQKS